jgi:hypothetical protein
LHEDKYSQAYVDSMKKQKRFKDYMNVFMKPGGIKPMRKFVQNEKNTIDVAIGLYYHNDANITPTSLSLSK